MDVYLIANIFSNINKEITEIITKNEPPIVNSNKELKTLKSVDEKIMTIDEILNNIEN